jgi:hypothetical protein
MAANIFSPRDYQLIIQRINGLTLQSTRQWGKINILQMLQHCAIQLKKVLRLISASEPPGPAIYRTAFGRWVALYVVPWPKGSATCRRI